jgi:DNA-binding winged helix-turn-helix (wHTH) protein/tetratricopeptide (TPR) repeat protein
MPGQNHEIYRFGRYSLSPSRHTLYLDDAEVPLTPRSFDVLLYLAKNPGRLVPKEELMQAVWPGAFVEEGNLAQQIFRLRKALEPEPGSANFILTVPGRGYQFTAEVIPGRPVSPFSADVTSDSSGAVLGEPNSSGFTLERWRDRTHVVVEELAVGGTSLPKTSSTILTGKKIGLAAIILALAALTSWAGWHWHQRVTPGQYRQIVLAEFTNSTGDAAFDHTLKRALEIDLEQSPYIDVMSDGEAVSTLHRMGLNADSLITPEIAKELCERSNRQVLLAGNIAQLGGEYLLTLEATNCDSGKRLTGAKAEATSREKVLAALDAIVDRVRSGLGESSRSLASYQVPIIDETTNSLEALKSYSIGVDMNLQGKGETETLPFFQRAVELDPQFAMAYGAIGSDYYNLNEMNLAAQYYKKAFDLSGRVSAKEKLILKAHYYAEGRNDLREGIETYRQWAEIYPNEWIPWANMANEYIQMGQYAQAIAAGERALQMEPNQALIYSVLVRAYRRANNFAEAKSIGLKAVQRQKDSANLHGSLYQIAIAEHDIDARTREAKWAEDHSSGWYGFFFADLQAEEYASEGKYRDAEGAFRRAWDTAERENLPESADDVLLDQAFSEFRFGQPTAARATLSRVRKLDPDAPDAPLLQAELGNSNPAETFLAAHSPETHPGTLMNFIYLPRVRAALATERGKPLDAVDALAPASPYELADYDVLSARATAFIRAGRPDLAVAEFQKIITNPGIDSVSILSPLAHLGLARAYSLEGNKARSKSEYENFLALWKDADSDIPVLQQARREYAQLK